MDIQERANGLLRALDRYLGKPLVCLCIPFRKKRTLPSSIHSIALLKSAAIGDTVLLSAIIQDLLIHFADAEITLFTGQSNVQAGRMISGVMVEPLPMSRPLDSLKLIRKKKFDLFIDFDSWPRITALLTFFSRSKYTMGFATQGQCRHYLYDHAHKHSFNLHELENYRALIAPLAMQQKHSPKIEMSMQQQKKRVVLHMFAGGSRAYLKQWPKERWQALIDWLAEQGYEVALTGGAGDDCASFSGATHYAGKLNLQETAKLLTESHCVVSVDTGIMHLAAALGCRVVALHGPTSPARWGGVGPNVISLQPDLKYTPCIQLGFESKCSKPTCMQAITVEQVQQAIGHSIESI